MDKSSLFSSVIASFRTISMICQLLFDVPIGNDICLGYVFYYNIGNFGRVDREGDLPVYSTGS